MFENFTLWDAVKIGGPIMYVLIVCSILSISIILERIFCYYRRSRVSRAAFMADIRRECEGGNLKKALLIANETYTPFAAVVAAGLTYANSTEKQISEAMEREMIIQSSELEQRTAIVGTIGSTAVYIGLLGTVWGIIKTFQYISKAASGGIEVVIGGVAEALVCTGAGLIVAIPAVIAYNYFVKKVNGFVIDMELCASELKSLLKV